MNLLMLPFVLAQAGNPFAMSFFILAFLFVFPGTVLGWIAARRIRESEGQLYGLRLAVVAAMVFPSLLLVALPLVACALVLRFGSVSLDFAKEDALVLMVVVFATLALFSVKIFQSCLRVLFGKGGIRELLSFRKNWLIWVVLILLWVGMGAILFVQRPRQIDGLSGSESSDEIYSVSASTWSRMRIFGSDRFFYRFELQGRGGTVHEVWDVPVPTAKLAKDYLSSPISEYFFESKGSIQWKDNYRKVGFMVSGVEVFEVSLDDLERGQSGVAISTGNAIDDFEGIPRVEILEVR